MAMPSCDADYDGERHADRERPQSLNERLVESAALDELKRGLEDRARRRHEDRIHATAVIFPDHEEDRDRGHADRVRAQQHVPQPLR